MSQPYDLMLFVAVDFLLVQDFLHAEQARPQMDYRATDHVEPKIVFYVIQYERVHSFLIDWSTWRYSRIFL